MIVKNDFVLLKGVDNLLNLSDNQIKNYTVENGVKLVSNVIEMLERSTDHFTKKSIFSQLSKPKEIAVVNIPNYSLHVSFNKPTKQIIFNLSPFNVDTITAISPDPRNIYAAMAYGVCFKETLFNLNRVKSNYSTVIISFLTSMFVQLFGREYGLLGKYSMQISRLKFLIGCYVLSSFFGTVKEQCYILAGRAASYNYREIEDELKKYNFSNIEDFIESLSDLKVLPGITKYHFTSRIFRLLSDVFLPGLEDFSRFISIITTSSIQGSTIVPRFLSRYNELEYSKILEISKIILR